ncbi:MAG: LysR substrate-binding domain-containing protein, partial [Pseudomonadota bacterium]
PLRLGALETTAGSRLPPILKALNQKCPRALVTLNTGPSGMLMQKVWNRQLDAAFVVGPVDLDRFRSELAFVETLVKTEASEPSNEAKTLLAFPEGCSYRAAARQWLTAIGQSDTPVRDLGSLDAILGCVGAGMGFAIVPESAINTYNALDTLRWAPLTEGFDRSETHLIWRHDTTVTRTLETLFEIIAASE